MGETEDFIMDRDFVFELIERVKDSKIEELEIQTSEGKIVIRQYHGPSHINISQAPAVIQESIAGQMEVSKKTAPVEVQETQKEKEKGYHIIKSPLVGTFYRAPSPGAPPFVEEGDRVSKGQVLCIIEALKVMNEIESDIDGKVVKVLVENGQPVEYGQELFYIEV